MEERIWRTSAEVIELDDDRCRVRLTLNEHPSEAWREEFGRRSAGLNVEFEANSITISGLDAQAHTLASVIKRLERMMVGTDEHLVAMRQQSAARERETAARLRQLNSDLAKLL